MWWEPALLPVVWPVPSGQHKRRHSFCSQTGRPGAAQGPSREGLPSLLPAGLCSRGVREAGRARGACMLLAAAWRPPTTHPRCTPLAARYPRALQYARSTEALRVLSEATDAQGRRFDVVKVPLPDPPLHLDEAETAGVQVRLCFRCGDTGAATRCVAGGLRGRLVLAALRNAATFWS